MRLSLLIPAVIIVALLAPAGAHASRDPLIEGAKLCTRQLPRYEREYGVPVHLLSAIASTESGRYHKGLKIALPWPWTINAEGKGYFYDTKEEAIKAAKKFRAQGVKSMDVGCMQVNLMHHPNAFSSLDEAFEPVNNVAYAASFLRTLYEELKTWKGAAAAYHSRTPNFGSQYVSRVFNQWYTIIDRVRGARSVVAQADVPMKMEPGVKIASAQPDKPAYKPMSIKSISVKTVSDRRTSPLVVVRPDPTPEPKAEAKAAQAEVPVPALAPVAGAVAMPITSTEIAMKSEAAVPALAPVAPQAVATPAPDAKVVMVQSPQSALPTVVTPVAAAKPAREAPRFIFSD